MVLSHAYYYQNSKLVRQTKYLKRSTSDKVRQYIVEHLVFFMGFDNSTHAIISKNDKLSFFETFAKWHSRGNVKKNNEINFRAIIVRAIKHRGSLEKASGKPI